MLSNRLQSGALWLVLIGVLPGTSLAQTRRPSQTPRRPGATGAAPAKAATKAEPRYKGIWEPVSYPDDLRLEDVFFATPDEGWAVGGATEMKGGIILHTSDGGDHWDVQYGDPQSSERAVRELRFLDATHGWAVQRTGQASRLFHTTDGHNWMQAGTIAEHHNDYMFTSEMNGVEVSREISITQDGGRRWRQVFQCAAKIQTAAGLFQSVDCELKRLQFVTPSVGYAVGYASNAKGMIFLVKTSDGGASWNMASATQVRDDGNAEDLFFIDENTGYVRVGYPDTGEVFKTTDGGQTWTGMAASPGNRIQFADPEVGWAMRYNKVSFTTDAGQHWNSREYQFPATTHAFSLPRRDRGYVVGEHGMIFRYRIVPEQYSKAGMMPAPLLSGIQSPLDSEVTTFATQVQRLAVKLGVPVGEMAASGEAGSGTAQTTGGNAAGVGTASGTAAGTAGGTAPAGTAGAGDSFSQNTDATVNSAGFTQDVSKAEGTLGTVAGDATQFAQKYRSLNLMASFQAATQLPGQVQELKESFAQLKQIKDGKSASAALGNIYSKVQGLMQSTKLAFLKK